MDTERFDVIIVGAGPAGLAAAKTIAEGGRKVIVLERGDYPGSKNVMGGILYRRQTEEIFPEFWKEAPLERPVSKHSYWLADTESATMMTYDSTVLGEEPYNAFSVFRAKFDKWMGEKVEAAGGLIITETAVTEIIKEKGVVAGVRTNRPEGDLYAPLVILAEGANSMLAQSLGLQKKLKPSALAVTAKEVLGLPAEKVEDRFALEKGKGATIEVFGDSTAGMMGTAFIYTNKESISIGVGATIGGIIGKKISPNELLERFKNHPSVRPLIRDAELLEYSAHMIPEGGYDYIPQLCDDGIMIVGDTAQFVNSIHREGSNLAMLSGRLAGKTALAAIDGRDVSKSALSGYENALKSSHLFSDLKKYRHVSTYFEHKNAAFTEYPAMVSGAMEKFFTVDGTPKKQMQKEIIRDAFKKRSMLTIGRDLLDFWRVLG